MAREKLPFQTTVTVRFEHPTDEISVPRNPLDNTTDGATCTYRVYDGDVDEVLSTAEASGQTTLSMTNAASFKIGDQVALVLDDKTIHNSPINAVDPDAGTITIDDVTTDTAAAGNRVRVQLGVEVAMTEYGTAALGSITYGFQAALSDTHPGLLMDRNIDIERKFLSSSGNALEVTCHVIKPKAECD